jgi:hypothetical protein
MGTEWAFRLQCLRACPSGAQEGLEVLVDGSSWLLWVSFLRFEQFFYFILKTSLDI